MATMHLYKPACSDIPPPKPRGRRAGEAPRAPSAAAGWPGARSASKERKQLERFLQLHGLCLQDSAMSYRYVWLSPRAVTRSWHPGLLQESWAQGGTRALLGVGWQLLGCLGEFLNFSEHCEDWDDLECSWMCVTCSVKTLNLRFLF